MLSIQKYHLLLLCAFTMKLFAMEQDSARKNSNDTDALHTYENNYLESRKSNLRKSLIAFINRSVGALQNNNLKNAENNSKAAIASLNELNQVLTEMNDDESLPCIDLCFSGGGFRATYLTLGVLQGAEASGFLDCCMHMAGLSGSTWALIALLARATHEKKNNTIEAFVRELQSKAAPVDKWKLLTESLTNTDSGLRILHAILNRNIDVDKTVKEKLAARPTGSTRNNASAETDTLEQEINDAIPTSQDAARLFFEMYGRFIIRSLLFYMNDDRSLQEVHHVLEQNLLNLPFPIYTALAKLDEEEDAWIERTPSHMGNINHNIYSPNNKNETDINGQEIYWYHWLATFGNVLGVSFSEFLENILGNIGRASTIQKRICQIIKTVLGKRLNDWLEGKQKYLISLEIPDFAVENPKKSLRLVDAGISFNIPWPPLRRRGADIVVIADWSECKESGEEYTKARKNTRNTSGAALPVINFSQPNVIRISYPTTNTPNVIHISWFDIAKQLRHTFSTFKLHYTNDEKEALITYGYKSVSNPLFIKKIADAIARTIKQRRQSTALHGSLTTKRQQINKEQEEEIAVKEEDDEEEEETPDEKQPVTIIFIIHRASRPIDKAILEQDPEYLTVSKKAAQKGNLIETHFWPIDDNLEPNETAIKNEIRKHLLTQGKRGSVHYLNFAHKRKNVLQRLWLTRATGS